MSKKTKQPTLTSTVTINGQTKATSVNRGGNVSTNYNLSDSEKYLYDYAGKALQDNISNVNILSPEVQQRMQSQIDAYTQKGIDTINANYNPMINATKNDIVSRFGNLDNTSFLSKLKSIESGRAAAQNALAQDILLKRDELVSNEMQNRYNFLNFMNDIQYQIMSNAMEHITNAQSAATGSSASAKKSSGYNNLDSYLNMASNALKFIF